MARLSEQVENLESERDRLYGQLDLVERQMRNLGKQLADVGGENERLRGALSWLEDHEPVLVDQARERFLVKALEQ